MAVSLSLAVFAFDRFHHFPYTQVDPFCRSNMVYSALKFRSRIIEDHTDRNRPQLLIWHIDPQLSSSGCLIHPSLVLNLGGYSELIIFFQADVFPFFSTTRPMLIRPSIGGVIAKPLIMLFSSFCIFIQNGQIYRAPAL